jgi:hypothetical protein
MAEFVSRSRTDPARINPESAIPRRSVSVLREPSQRSLSSGATPSLYVQPNVSLDIPESSPIFPESSIPDPAPEIGRIYSQQPKPTWIPDTPIDVETGESDNSRTLLYILGTVLFIFLAFLVGYVLYHWLWAKHTIKTVNNTNENQQIKQSAYNDGRQAAQEEAAKKLAEAAKAKSIYGEQFPLGGTDCEDTHPSCPAWASNDECWINPGYMLYKCPKSCQTCGLDTTTLDKIRDSNLSRCQDWGDCSNAQCTNWYHALRCRKTCFSGGCDQE